MIIRIWLIGYNYNKSTVTLSILPIIINRTGFQYICENCLKQGLQKFGQTGRDSGLLVSVSVFDAQRNCTKRHSHFLPLKIPGIIATKQTLIIHEMTFPFSSTENTTKSQVLKRQYYCLIIKERKKRVINNKTKKQNYFSACNKQLVR